MALDEDRRAWLKAGAGLGILTFAGQGRAQSVLHSLTSVGVPGNAYASLEKGSPRGLIIEATDYLLRKMGRSPSYIATPTSDAIRAMGENRLDVATVIVPSGRVNTIAYISDPVIQEINVVITPKGDGFQLNKISDLSGKTLATREGYRYPLLEQNSDIQLKRFKTDAEMLRAMFYGEVNAAVISGISDIFALRAEGVMNRIDVMDRSVGSVPLAVAFNKKKFSEADVQSFNQMLGELKRSTEWENIASKNGMQDLLKEWKLAEKN